MQGAKRSTFLGFGLAHSAPPSLCLSFPIHRTTVVMLSCSQGSLSLQPCEAMVPEHKNSLLALWDKSYRHLYPLPGGPEAPRAGHGAVLCLSPGKAPLESWHHQGAGAPSRAQSLPKSCPTLPLCSWLGLNRKPVVCRSSNPRKCLHRVHHVGPGPHAAHLHPLEND